jgi:hypothetical protein
MLEDLFSQVPEDEIDFSLLEDADDSNEEGLGALGRKRSTRKGRRRKTARRAYVGLKRKRRTRRKSTRKGKARKTARRAYVGLRKKRRRKSGLSQLAALAAPKRSTRKRMRRKTARRAYQGLQRKRRKVRRAKRGLRRARRRVMRKAARSGLRGLGFFGPKENKAIIGGFNWSLGTKDGRMSVAGIAAGSLISQITEKAFNKWVSPKVNFLAQGTMAAGVATTAISSILGWELGRLAKSKDLAKFAFLFAWGKFIDAKLTQPIVSKIPGLDGLGYNPQFGQLRVPDSTELDGLAQLRVPDSTELDGLGQMRVTEGSPVWTDFDNNMEGMPGVGVGQYEVDEEDEDSDVF